MTTYILTFETEAAFGAFYALLHYGVGVAAHFVKDRTLQDVVREAALADQLEAISDPDPGGQHTPAGSLLRQLRGPATLEVDGETLAMIDRYVRHAAERIGPDWARAAVQALELVRRAHEGR